MFFLSHWLLSHIIIVVTMDSGERGMNPVAITIISAQKEYWPSRGQNQGLGDVKKGIYSFPNKPLFLHVYSTSLLKTLWEKEKLLVTSNFSFSHSIFYPFGELSSTFIKFKIVVCKLLSLEESKICHLGMGQFSFSIPIV